jgi:hypothetical protein
MWICSWSGVDFVRARCESRGGLGRARFWQFNHRQKRVSQFYHPAKWFRSFAIMNMV